MNNIEIFIVTKEGDLPLSDTQNFFHSNELFRIVEHTPGLKPYLVVAKEDDNVVARMLVMMRRRGALVPPYLFTQGRVYGEGEYLEGYDREELFGMMLRSITKKLIRKLCLYIEFSHLSNKMFAYGKFRENDFFPLRWMEVKNSLHSLEPRQRLNERAKRRLGKAAKSCITTQESSDEEDFLVFYKLLKKKITLKVRRFVPNAKLFLALMEKGYCKLFITREKEMVTGGCVCLYAGKDSYLWYLTSKTGLKKKRSVAVTVWTAIKYAFEKGFDHISFMDVGLPLRKNTYRELILDFGGKPSGTYRWFRCSVSWINRLLSWLYRE